MDIINKAFLRANSINAVRITAIHKGHNEEAKELEKAQTMITELIDYIKSSDSEVKLCLT